MNFTFLCLVIFELCLYGVYARFNKDVVCVIAKDGSSPVCNTVTSPQRRQANIANSHLPLYDPYIPHAKAVFYNCSSLECVPLKLYTIKQLSSPTLKLKTCFPETSDSYKCESIRFNYLKNLDKLLLLSSNIANKTFYLVDCLVYSDGGRVCLRNDKADSHTELVDIGTIARPNQTNVLSQDELLCEEDELKRVACDLNNRVPYIDGLRYTRASKLTSEVLLKTGDFVVPLKFKCVDDWCDYRGSVPNNRRYYGYEPPGGRVYRCFYAKQQHICKLIYQRESYND